MTTSNEFVVRRLVATSLTIAVNDVAPALCVIDIGGEALIAYLGWWSCW